MIGDRYRTMGAGEIADLLDKNELAGRDYFNCVCRAMSLLRKQAQTEAAKPAVPVEIAPEEMEALKRFEETTQDGEGYDVPKAMMTRLAEIGLIRRTTANYYMFTDFGNTMLSAAPPLPVAQGWQPMDSAPKADGEEILALVQWKWQKEPRRRILNWNDGIGKVGYTWPCWMCSVSTVQIPDEIILGWMPLSAATPPPAAPKEPTDD